MTAERHGRIRVRVEGLVQGVGFRPFVSTLAGTHDLAGFVGNDPEGVFIEAQGEPSALRAFVADLERRAPPLALVEHVAVTDTEVVTEVVAGTGFRIVASRGEGVRQVFVPPDTPPCESCAAETIDPAARRHGYAFTNCTACGPRFTIITDLPYDRRNTTMAGFGMCPRCSREYLDPADRRFHAQPVCCPACGPSLRLLGADGRPAPGDPVGTAALWLAQGGILAVKGVGGFHLAAVAGDERAVSTLRARKHREGKPFAVLAADLAAARELVLLTPGAEDVLAGPRRPVVLLPRRPGGPVAASVAPGNRELGVLLPPTPLHLLLAVRLGVPAVLTSGNRSDEPIAHRDEDALERLSGLADGFLTHDRPIHVRADDSVVRVFRGRELPVRRSRGYVPVPLLLRRPPARHVLACGGELKNTFCLVKGRHAILSQHIGDLEGYETLRSYTEGIGHLSRLFGVRPRLVAHDPHPEYLSTKYAFGLDDVDLVGVQHHHAHIASCLADNGEEGPVIGVALDGLGLGDDGTLWGGELLVAGLRGFERAGHLEALPMPGGAAAVRQPWRMGVAYLDAIYGDAPPDLPFVRRHRERWAAVAALARTGTNAPLTSSAGRLFDAVAAIAGLRDRVSFEGQAAIELEQLADPDERGGYPAALTSGRELVLSGADLVRGAVEDLLAGAAGPLVSARFHNGLARVLVRAVLAVRERTGLRDAALSGGVFQNVVLLERVVSGLEAAGLRVLVHSRVPPNDGGLSLGQAAVAAALDADG
ncbi:carbamoyltransferase HypF [Nonomuraea spiralis]|uniref:Carbamoyltransferase n=1 Tax=Nonomuraea spiralis TaxID=46182 RepID=A0ABV5IH87_9ACTN|nr:carbamoyltransferase HypF [Nonomuraea spiralis]GGS98157.1 carbamoyltransferase [Nonomuraea spiralis]